MRQALAITAKAPRPGHVKTRLHGLLSVEDATRLYCCFLKDALALAETLPAVETIVSYTPKGFEGYFKGIVSSGHRMLAQRGDGLGDKLINAFDDLFGEGFEAVALMNADSPTLPRAYLAEAFEALRRPGDRVVVGPAEDGGYYFVGIKRRHPCLFERISWSSERVLAETIGRAREIGLEVMLLPQWYDVDRAFDFERLRREIIEAARPGDSISQTDCPPDDQQNVSYEKGLALTAINTRDFILSRSCRDSAAHTK
jgi:uncharacterized protein